MRVCVVRGAHVRCETGSGSAGEAEPEVLRAAMAGRGKLIAVVGDEDTVTGFLLGGVGELNAQRKPNFLVVEKETSVAEIEETFRCGGGRGLRGRSGPEGAAEA